MDKKNQIISVPNKFINLVFKKLGVTPPSKTAAQTTPTPAPKK